MQGAYGKVFVGKFVKDEDLLAGIKEICEKENVSAGEVSVIGSLTSVRMLYYNQETQKYIQNVNQNEKVEIVSCSGNVSLKDGKVFVHAHAIVSDYHGNCFGGHLTEGSQVFAGEYIIKEITGVTLQRKLDNETGLSLWA